MIILFALLIPIVTALVLYFFFSHKTLWWEFLIPFLASIILVVIMKFSIEHMSVQSDEYWGALVEHVEYHEEWDEWVTQMCPYSCCCDSKGQNCQTRYRDCSHKVTHQPYWTLFTTIGEQISVSETEYHRMAKALGTERFTELNRDYYRIDGDMYSATWRKDSLTAIPVTTLHSYENRVKASDVSVFHFDDLLEEDVKRYHLHEYPSITDGYKMDAVLGDSSADAMRANKKLKYINGSLGHSKEVCAFILVFKDQPLEVAFKQEAHWKGANMNEFVVCVGIDNERNVQWSKVISWTTNELLKVEVKSIMDKQEKLNLCSFVDQLQPQLASFQRRDFKEFDYLTVEPSWGAIILTYFLVIVLNVGLSRWVITNEHSEGGISRSPFSSRSWRSS